MTSANRAVTFIFVTVLLNSVGFGIVMPVLPELIVDVTGDALHDAARHAGWLAFVYALMQFFCAPLAGNLSDRFGRRPVLLLSLFVFGLDYLIMGFAPTLAWLYVGRLVAGMSATSFAIANACVADLFPPEKRAQNFGRQFLIDSHHAEGLAAAPSPREVVFGDVRLHLTEDRSHGADHNIVGHERKEYLRRAFLRKLAQTPIQLLRLQRIARPHTAEQFGCEVRNATELEVLALAEGVRDLYPTVIGQADDVPGVCLISPHAATRHEGDGVRHLHLPGKADVAHAHALSVAT